MLKETVTYKNFKDVEVTKDFYFNLSEQELMEMELTTKGGLGATIQAAIDAEDNATLIKIFKELLLKAYGELSEDGEYFVKSAEKSTLFSQSAAYQKLFMELATNEEKASKFINGIIPQTTNAPKALQ